MKVFKQIEVVAFCALTSVLFAEKVAPYGESVVVDVAAGSSETETGPVMVDPSSRGMEKTGGGTYVLPLSAMASRYGFKAQVREGKLTLADTGAEGVSVAAPECLQNAALWLDAGQNTVVEDGVVTKWLDVREGATDNNAYYCAGGGSSPGTASDGGKTWIDFGGANSGKYFELLNANRTTLSLSTVYHVFAVIDTTSAYGHVFGVRNNYEPTFYPGNYAGASSGNYWHATECDTALYSGRTYVDGVWIDGAQTPVKVCKQLLEWEAGNQTAKIHYFFRDRSVDGRQGGAMMGEVVLFTNRLDSVDRMKVEEYLMQKWLGKGRPNSYAFKTAAGAEVEFNGLADEEFAKVSVTGLGAAEKQGAGTVTWRDTGRNPGVPWRIAQGAMAFESGDIPLSFESGDALAAATDDYGVTTLTRSQGAAGTVSSIGGGAARVSALPNDTTSFSFSGAALSLAAPAAAVPGAVLGGDVVFATIPNADFEAWTSQQWKGSDWTSENWSFTPNGGVVMVARTEQSQWNNYVKLPKPASGRNVLGLRPPKSLTDVATASTTVVFPSAGRYELTFKAYGRTSQNGAPTDFSLVKGGNEIRFARIHGIAWAEGMRTERFLTPEVEAGEYTLKLTARNHTTDEKWTFFDDLKMRLVTDIPAEVVFEVPNGGFEYSDISSFSSMNTANTAQGWTLTATTSGDPDVGLASRAMTSNGRFNAGSAKSGNIQLAFFNNAGFATSDAFTLPAGKWRLRFRAGRLTSYQKWNDQRVAGTPAFAATATVNGSDVSLGSTSSILNSVFQSFVLPNAIESDGSAQVSLKIRQTQTETKPAALLVDDLEFVRVDDLVENGNFEDASGSNSDGGVNGGWTLAFNRPENGKAKAELVDPSNAEAWGRTRCEGTYALHIVDCGAASRSITFPESGLYRISFRARGRASYASGGDTPDMTYAGNRVKALLDGVEIYRSPAIGTTNFVAYSGMFRIAEAGTKTFAIQGCAASGDKNAFVDLLSIEKAAVADVPDIPKTAEINVRLADGEKLRLDYPGTLNLKSLCVNGKNLSREISAETRPDFISGPGSVYVEPNGLIITFR